MRAIFLASSVVFGAVLALASSACSSDKNGGDGDGGTGGNGTPDACAGLQCMQVSCSGMGAGTTSVSGTVFAPNGTLPLFGVNVYVPNSDPGALDPGLTCDRCTDALPGDPVVRTVTDEAGHFSLTNVPVAADVPLVIQIGKWRKQIKIANVVKCMDTPLLAADTTLPSSYDEAGAGNVVSVDMPRIAITTGKADALECLVRKLGIADKEITNDSGAGHVHLYAGNGANKLENGWAGGSGASLSSATKLWNTLDQLKSYDIVIFSCEGNQDQDTAKSSAAMKAVFDYANLGGRVFLSHWHNVWLEGNTQDHNPPTNLPPAPWPTIATFTDSSGTLDDGTIGTVDEAGFAHGASFATWLLNVGGSTTRDQIAINDGKQTCDSISDNAERWVYLDPATAGGQSGVQNFQFTTPNDADPADRCGKVAFSDMHVASGSKSDPDTAYPGGCSSDDLTAQEKALAFMFFDISSCVGPPIEKPAP